MLSSVRGWYLDGIQTVPKKSKRKRLMLLIFHGKSFMYFIYWTMRDFITLEAFENNDIN